MIGDTKYEIREKFKRFTFCVSRLTSPKGFTFIELLVAGFIIGATFTFGVAKYNEFNRRQIVIQAAEELKSHLRSAQSKALAGEKNCSVCQVGGECGDGDDLTLNGWCVSFSSYGYQIYGSCGLGVDEQLFSATTVDLGSRNLEILPASPICFLPLGQRVEGASTITLSGYGETREVKVSTLGEIK